MISKGSYVHTVILGWQGTVCAWVCCLHLWEGAKCLLNLPSCSQAKSQAAYPLQPASVFPGNWANPQLCSHIFTPQSTLGADA